MDTPVIKIRRNSPEWEQILAYAESRLAYHRQQLESESVPSEKVPALRARIAELRALVGANKWEG